MGVPVWSKIFTPDVFKEAQALVEPGELVCAPPASQTRYEWPFIKPVDF